MISDDDIAFVYGHGALLQWIQCPLLPCPGGLAKSDHSTSQAECDGTDVRRTSQGSTFVVAVTARQRSRVSTCPLMSVCESGLLKLVTRLMAYVAACIVSRQLLGLASVAKPQVTDVLRPSYVVFAFAVAGGSQPVPAPIHACAVPPPAVHPVTLQPSADHGAAAPVCHRATREAELDDDGSGRCEWGHDARWGQHLIATPTPSCHQSTCENHHKNTPAKPGRPKPHPRTNHNNLLLWSYLVLQTELLACAPLQLSWVPVNRHGSTCVDQA